MLNDRNLAYARKGQLPAKLCKQGFAQNASDAAADKWHGRALQRSDRRSATKPSRVIRRRAGGHAAPLRLALQPAIPALSLGQQVALA